MYYAFYFPTHVFQHVLFLLVSVQTILLLPICSTSRWRWHTKLALSTRKGSLPTQTDRNLLRRTAFLLDTSWREKSSNPVKKAGSNGSNIPVLSKRLWLWLSSPTYQDLWAYNISSANLSPLQKCPAQTKQWEWTQHKHRLKGNLKRRIWSATVFSLCDWVILLLYPSRFLYCFLLNKIPLPQNCSQCISFSSFPLNLS